jgi:hypothetical protein
VEEGRIQEESGGLQLVILKLAETGTESGGMLAPNDAPYPVAACRQRMMMYTQCCLCNGSM